tara:strand:+ start:33892 stop:34317 length:426 start_codon:yes stop_codon:yes gene_type:complete
MIEVIVAGNLTKDAELRPAGNSQVCGFSVAADTGFGDKKQTMFFSCSLWGNQGAALAQYLKKGNPVTVIGEMSEREYDGKQYKEIRVNSIKLQGGRNDNQQNNQGYNNQQSDQPQQGFNNQMSQAPRTTMNNAVIDDDCPF